MSLEGRSQHSSWPDLAALDLISTMQSLHLWSQVVGKVRLMLTPWENHGWHVPFYLTSRGLATGLIPLEAASASIEFNLLSGSLEISRSDGRIAAVPLRARSVASFYRDTMAALGSVGITVEIDTMPAELPGAVRFEQDLRQREYDADVARTYWQALVETARVFQLFRTRFVGKCSPIHLFWGSFDLAVTRFSGRGAPRHPGGAPHMPNAVAREAYSQEVSSAGFWPNLDSSEGPCFYSYAYPVPDGFAGCIVGPEGARFEATLGEFLLPYEAVRTSADPDAALLAFLQSTYEAAADPAGWDRAALERPTGGLGHPPAGS